MVAPRRARLGCGGAKMSGSAAHTDNFKFFFGGINSEFAKRMPDVFYEKFKDKSKSKGLHSRFLVGSPWCGGDTWRLVRRGLAPR